MVGVTMPPETDVEHIELWADASIFEAVVRPMFQSLHGFNELIITNSCSL